METTNRDETEAELAAVILLLWIIFSDLQRAGVVPYPAYLEEFNRLVRPPLTRIYGRARSSLAEAHGHAYPTRDLPGGGQSILIPGLTNRIDRYAQELYERFTQRQIDIEARRAQGEEPPDFDESDASRFAVTETTRVHSDGEMDASRDVESRVGKRLVAVWRTEPGACKICSPLEGTIREWRLVFPGGPPGHPNCRCSLEWREFLG